MLLLYWLLTLPTVSEQIGQVAVIRLPQKEQSLGKEYDHWLARLRPAVKNKPSHVVRKVITLREARFCLWTRSKTKSNTRLRRHRRVKRETQKTNKTVVVELKLEAPFSVKRKGVLHLVCSGKIQNSITFPQLLAPNAPTFGHYLSEQFP